MAVVVAETDVVVVVVGLALLSIQVACSLECRNGHRIVVIMEFVSCNWD